MPEILNPVQEISEVTGGENAMDLDNLFSPPTLEEIARRLAAIQAFEQPALTAKTNPVAVLSLQ